MGIILKCRDKQPMIKSEIYIGKKPIQLKIVFKVMKSICKITIKTKKGIAYGT